MREIVREDTMLTNADGRTTDSTLEALANGCPLAWRTTMDRFSPVVNKTLAGFRFDQATKDDVTQDVWIKLFRNARSIKTPEAIGGWLRTTTRNTAIEVVRHRERWIPVEDVGHRPNPEPEPDPTPPIEHRRALAAGFRKLSRENQQLLALVFDDDPMPYTKIAVKVGRPTGSLGPTRARALRCLRSHFNEALAA